MISLQSKIQDFLCILKKIHYNKKIIKKMKIHKKVDRTSFYKKNFLICYKNLRIL
jgi:hypothetical protein